MDIGHANRIGFSENTVPSILMVSSPFPIKLQFRGIRFSSMYGCEPNYTSIHIRLLGGVNQNLCPMGPQNLVSNINHLIIGYSILIHTSTQFGISTSTGGHPARPAASGARVAPPELYSPLPRPVAGHRDIWQYTCGRWPATLKNNHMLT